MKNNLPLEGITVLELGNSVAAPFAGEILGDLGADVIKVEKRDGGDDARKWAPPYWHGTSAIFQNFNRNKRSIVVELRDPEENEHCCDRKQPARLSGVLNPRRQATKFLARKVRPHRNRSPHGKRPSVCHLESCCG